jgi:serine/threonine protein kinase
MQVGEKIGEYEVLDELGRGAHACVYKARSPQGKLVAIKVLAKTGKDGEARRRFEREQRLLAALGEPEGFVPILDSGVASEGPFFVMPFLAKGTLRARLDKGALGVEEAYQLGRQLAVAIGWAHQRDIVHRDLKPENILFTDDGRPLISDLGIAKHFIDMAAEDLPPDTAKTSGFTKMGEFLGTPTYMAPEQMTCAKTVGPQADIYSLGAILYECLAGRPPFEAKTV